MKMTEKKVYRAPQFRMIELNHADIIATSGDLSAQSDFDPDFIEYGGEF